MDPDVAAAHQIIVAIGAAGALIAADLQSILAGMVRDGSRQDADSMTLLLRSTSAAALESLEGGRHDRAERALIRMAASAWLTLVTLRMAVASGPAA